MIRSDCATLIRSAFHFFTSYSHYMSDLEVNFDSLIINVEQLGGGSARCVELFERVKPEYRTLRDCLNHIRKLEEAIHTYETRRRRR
ncbi:hypothetical protein ACOSP7_013232 [Xanthoceras sorbifolium]